MLCRWIRIVWHIYFSFLLILCCFISAVIIILNILFLIVSYKYSGNMENQFAKTNVSFQFLFYEKKNDVPLASWGSHSIASPNAWAWRSHRVISMTWRRGTAFRAGKGSYWMFERLASWDHGSYTVAPPYPLKMDQKEGVQTRVTGRSPLLPL